MNNPWEEIKLDDYEKHMSLDSVKQLQTMNKMMKEQFDAYQVNTAMIFGIAGGNGLEHVSKEKYQAFVVAVHRVDPDYVSCVIQINTDEKNWVSDSPYIHVFDRLDEVHSQMEQDELVSVMEGAGYQKILEETESLPNGKALLRIDFKKGKERTYGIN